MTLDKAEILTMIEVCKGLSEVAPEHIAEAQAIVEAPQEPELPEPFRLEKIEAPSPIPAAIPADEASKDIRAQIAEMTMPQKIKMALFGNSIARMLLILDTNRMIQGFVLKNPKLTISEVESFAKNPHSTDFVLRIISDSRQWMKSSSVKYYLVTNPKTPGDIALKWLRYLNVTELRKIAKSKNIPQLVVVTAKKRVAELDKE